MNKHINKEEIEQRRLIEWARLMANRYPELNLLNASLSGVKLSIGQARKAKSLGMVKGFPDLFLPVVNKEYAGLFIEMKRKKGGRLTPEQKAWLEILNQRGYKAVCCRGFEEARAVIEEYLKQIKQKQKQQKDKGGSYEDCKA